MYYTLIYNYESQNNQILILLLSVLRAPNQFNFQNGVLNISFEGFLDIYYQQIIDDLEDQQNNVQQTFLLSLHVIVSKLNDT